MRHIFPFYIEIGLKDESKDLTINVKNSLSTCNEEKNANNFENISSPQGCSAGNVYHIKK